MKYFSVIPLALCVATAVGSEQLRGSDQRALYRVGGGMNGCWWQFHYYHGDYCVEKIDDPDDKTSDKVKFTDCDDMNAAQMWKFDKEYPNDMFTHGGLLYNMDGGCLAIQGPVEEGKNLKVLKCDRNNPKQHWVSDGDALSPRDHKDLCVSPKNHHDITNHGPVVLVHCDGADFLDYY